MARVQHTISSRIRISGRTSRLSKAVSLFSCTSATAKHTTHEVRQTQMRDGSFSNRLSSFKNPEQRECTSLSAQSQTEQELAFFPGFYIEIFAFNVATTSCSWASVIIIVEYHPEILLLATNPTENQIQDEDVQECRCRTPRVVYSFGGSQVFWSCDARSFWRSV